MTSQADSVRMNCANATEQVTATLFSADVWERFWSKVDKRGPDECWEWRGSRTEAGYGQFGAGGRVYVASRVVASTIIGRPLRPSPEEMACHKCDRPPCVNPAHIFVGSAFDNAMDMMRKGRHARGAKTRLGRIEVAMERQLDRLVHAILWAPSKLRIDLFTMAPIEDLAVACNVQVNDAELEDAPDTDEQLDTAAASAALDMAIASLPFKMRAAMHLRRQGLTLEDIGQRLGVTREYIRQLEEKAIPKLQKHPAIAVLIRGKPFPAPVKRHSISTERARDINEKCAAFFAKRKQLPPVPTLRGTPANKPVERARIRRRPSWESAPSCSFCNATDHVLAECIKRWRAERRREAA